VTLILDIKTNGSPTTDSSQCFCIDLVYQIDIYYWNLLFLNDGIDIKTKGSTTTDIGDADFRY
jgi:hypothetical protein